MLCVFSMGLVAFNASATTVLDCHLLNEEDEVDDYSNGPNNHALLNIWLMDKDEYANPGYDDHEKLNMDDSAPANACPDIDTYWESWDPQLEKYIGWAPGDRMIGVYEVTNGARGYHGPNYTGSFMHELTLDGVQTTVSWLSLIPEVDSEVVDDQIVLSWTAQTERGLTVYNEDEYEETTFDTIVTYKVYSNINGQWGLLGYADQLYDAGEKMTYSMDISETDPGEYHFQIAPVYKYVNYTNTGATYTTKGKSEIADVFLTQETEPVQNQDMVNAKNNACGLEQHDNSVPTQEQFLANLVPSIALAFSPTEKHPLRSRMSDDRVLMSMD